MHITESSKCPHTCPGGHECCLSADVKDHVWHICSDKDCPCHSRERYEGERHAKQRGTRQTMLRRSAALGA
jgi:hypothetical protein